MLHLRPSRERRKCRIRVYSGPPLNANIRIPCISAFRGHTRRSHALDHCRRTGKRWVQRVDGVEAVNHHSKVSSGCEIILNSCRSADTVAVCTAGRAPRGGESPSRKRPRASHGDFLSGLLGLIGIAKSKKTA